MEKPNKPDINIPEEFAPLGVKNNFESDKLINGFDRIEPDVLTGDNLNKFIDDSYKGLDYATRGVKNIYEQGLPEYDPLETYNLKSIVKVFDADDKFHLYRSLANDNIGNPLSDNTKWAKIKLGGTELPLLSTIIVDHILTGDEAVGWALQGSLVTMTYPDAVNKIIELYAGGTEEVYRGITCKRSTDGRYIADIGQKSAIDALYASSGVAEFYILDSVNQQFYLPRNDYFEQFTADTNKVNQFVEAGLPNITGKLASPYTDFSIIENGALTTSIYGPANLGGSTQSQPNTIELDASLSSPIYGNSETVQPPASLKLLYYKVGNTVVNESLIDVGNVLSELQLKADKDLGNATPCYAFTSMASGWSMPSDKSIDLAVTELGNTVVNVTNTAPANGYFIFNAMLNTQSTYIRLKNENTGYAQTAHLPTSGNIYGDLVVPALRNETATLTYIGSFINTQYRFVYAEGDAND